MIPVQHAPNPSNPAPVGSMLQEVFTLEEGPVTLTFPRSLSASSYEDLRDYFDLFLRKAKRQSEKRAQATFERAEQSVLKSLGGEAEREPQK